MKNAICFQCACVFPQKSNMTIECPDCHYQADPQTYENLLAYATDAVNYGYHYRLLYENEYEYDTSLSTRASILVEEIWTFCALAALSGIIGNAAYDLLKTVILKIVGQFKQKNDSHQVEQIIKILEDPTQFELLMRYLKDFHNGMPGLNPTVKRAILEEMEVDALSQAIIPALTRTSSRGSKKYSSEEIANRIMSQYRSKHQKANKSPERGDFEDFWQPFE